MRSTLGFTIIETSLFLAISGVLIVGMITTAGISLTNQRYKDAATTLRDVLQEQYSNTLSVQSSRPTDLSCTTTAQITDTGVGENIGQSECAVIGRYVRIDNGGLITTYNVLARQTGSAANLSDVASLQANYALGVDTSEMDDTKMEWGTQISWPKSGAEMRANVNNREFGMLVVRSPDSGRVYTFTTNTIPADKNSVQSAYLKSMIVTGNGVPGQAARVLCVSTDTWNTSEPFAVHINGYASGSSAIDLWTNQILLDDGALYGNVPSAADSSAGPSQC